MISKIVQALSDRYFVWKYLRVKKEQMVSDIYVPEWRAELRPKDIYNYTIQFDIGNGHIATATVIDIEEFGPRARGVHLNLDKIDDKPFIVHCSRKEVHTEYLPTLRYLIERDCTLDILKIKEEINHDTNDYSGGEKTTPIDRDWGVNVQ